MAQLVVDWSDKMGLEEGQLHQGRGHHEQVRVLHGPIRLPALLRGGQVQDRL